MSMMTTEPMADQALMDEVRRLAALAPHRLSADMTGATPLTEKQARNVCSYLARRIPLPGQDAAIAASAAQPASPKLPPMAAFRHLPEGYYGTPSRTGTNDFDFWRIDRPSSGKWAGYTFVRRVLGGGTDSEMRTEQLHNMQQRAAAQAIVEFGIDKSQALFAAKLERCVDCGRWLTDEDSRTAGRGPVCRAKKGR